MMKRLLLLHYLFIFFLVLILEGLVGLAESFFIISGWGIDLDYCDVEWFALEMNQDHSVVFEIAPKHCISELFVDCESYSISSNEFLTTVVGTIVIWIKLIELVRFRSWIPKLLIFTLAISCLAMSNYLDFIGLTFQDLMFFTASYFHNQTHPQLSIISSLPSHFILSGTISNCPPLFLSRILDTFWPGELIFQCHISLLFHTVHVVLMAKILEWLSIPSSSGPQLVRTLHYDPSALG